MRIRSLLIAGVLVSASLAARADSFTTFDLNSSYIFGGTIDGTLTLDTTTDLFTAADLTIAGFVGYQDGTISDVSTQGRAFGEYDVSVVSNGSPYADLNLFLPTTTLAGFDGSPVVIPTDVLFATFPNVYFAGSGTLEPTSGTSVTPEPGSLLLLATGLLGLAGLTWRRFVA
jgi:hypothetical protein